MHAAASCLAAAARGPCRSFASLRGVGLHAPRADTPHPRWAVLHAARRHASDRCLEYMDEWVWAPHSDQQTYFQELLSRPLRDELTGSEVRVLGVSQHSHDSAQDVRDEIAKLRDGPRGRSLSVCIDFYDHEAVAPLLQAHSATGVEDRKEAVESLADCGYPPDLLAESIANAQQRGLEPLLATAAAVAECGRHGTPVHFLGLNPTHTFVRTRHVYKTCSEVMGSVDPASAKLLPSHMGLHANPSAHLVSEHLAGLYTARPSPELVRNRLTTIDAPTHFFRYVHPTVHYVRRVKDLLWESQINNGVFLVVVDAVCAPMFYKIFKDEGLQDEDACGIQAEFRDTSGLDLSGDAASGKANPSAEPGNEAEVFASLQRLDDSLDEAPPEVQQASFEVELLLFLHLTRIRPDLLMFKQAVANVFLMNGLFGKGITYLRSLVDARVDGAENVLRRIIDEMVSGGILASDDPFVAAALSPPRDAPPMSAQEDEMLRRMRRPVGHPSDKGEEGMDGGVDFGSRMIVHNADGVARPEVVENLPEVDGLQSDELTERRAEVVGNALSVMKEKQVMSVTPTEVVQRAMEESKRKAQGLQFGATALHPYGEAHYSTPGGDKVSYGVAHGLQRYRPNSDFPVPPPKQSAIAEQAEAAQKFFAKQTAVDCPIEDFANEAKRIRTTSPPRTDFDLTILKDKKEERKAMTQYRAKESSRNQWAYHFKRKALGG